MVKKSKTLPRATPEQDSVTQPSDLLPATTELRALRMGKPGALLMRKIMEEGGRRGLGKTELAEVALGIQRSHFFNLCTGEKDVANLGPEAIARAALFLRMTPVEVRLLAGQLTPTDFYVGGPDNLRDALQTAMHAILDDPEIAPFAPIGILRADESLQAFIVHLYERATGKPLIPTKLTTAETLKRYQALIQVQDDEGSASGADFDRVLRACRSQGISLRSARLRSGTFVDALGLCVQGQTWVSDRKSLDIAQAVGTFATELRLLDSVDPQTELFTTGVVAAALLALALDASTVEFFRRLAQAQGNSGSGSLPQPIRRLLTTMGKVRRRESDLLREQELCAQTLQAVDSWKKPEHAGAAQEPHASALSGLLTRTVNRVRAHKAVQDDR
jgi:hypothetical protein